MQEEDFLRELGYGAFTSRLKRISDAMLHEGRSLYSALDVDIEPNWFIVFKLLRSRGPMSIMEIAESIKMSHPSVITIVNKMMKTGYVFSEKDPEDSRRRLLNLTEYALTKLPEYENIWDAGSKGLEKILKKIDGLSFIKKLEDEFYKKGFKERTIEHLDTVHLKKSK